MGKNILNLLPDAFKIIVGAGLWDTFKELAKKWIQTKLDPTRRQAFFRAYITNMVQGNLKIMYDKACENELKLPDGTTLMEDNFVDLFSDFSAEDLMLASVTMDMMKYEDAVKALNIMYNNPLPQRIHHLHKLAKKWLNSKKIALKRNLLKASSETWLKALTLIGERKTIANNWNKQLLKSAKKDRTRPRKTKTADELEIARLEKKLKTKKNRNRRWR